MNTQNMTFQRRYDLDWLRVLAIFTVFVYHCSLIFAPDAYQVKNPIIYPYLDRIGAFVGLWGMPLIFIISGASAFFALGKVSAGTYIKGLAARLLVPLVFGIFTHCALQIYIESLQKDTFHGSFFDFYPHYFDGLYAFGGNFAWMGMHLWYLEALFLFSMLCLPVFFWLKKRSAGQKLLTNMGNAIARPGAIYLLVLPVYLIGLLLDPDGIGTTVLGGWNIFAYLLFFISGFVIISNDKLQASIRQMRWVSLIAGILLWGVFFPIWEALGDPTFGMWQWMLGSFLWCLCTWFWLLTIFGFGFQHLQRTTPFLRYANEAVLPFYILHQPVILTVAFFVVGWAIPDLFKFIIIFSVSLSVVMLLYEFLVRRLNPLRFLFGMKLVTKPADAKSQARQVLGETVITHE
jgi:peptidoglycan/LPS O-acetylase OafA/YrhL